MYQKIALDSQNATGAYDVIMVDGSWFTEFCESGILADLSSKGYTLDEDFIEGTTKGGLDANGNVYCIPFFGNVQLFYYNKDVLAKACENAVRRLILGELTADQACHNIGTAAVAIVKRYMRTVQPPKSSLTLASAPGKTAPLVQTGRLRDSITYEVTGL